MLLTAVLVKDSLDEFHVFRHPSVRLDRTLGLRKWIKHLDHGVRNWLIHSLEDVKHQLNHVVV